METIALTRKRRSQRDYSLAFKISVITQVEKGELTYKQAQRLYGIQGRSTVLTWLRKLGTLDWADPKAHQMEQKKEKTPEQRIKELEAELQQEKDRNLLLNTIIDVAEKQHGFSIRKKRSPKQQSNSSNQED